jgi:serine/threonine protein kinase
VGRQTGITSVRTEPRENRILEVYSFAVWCNRVRAVALGASAGQPRRIGLRYGVHQDYPCSHAPPTYNPHHLVINPGTRLGVHEVTAQIGVGGMGQVFRARDTKLNRDVALKVLPESFAKDPERLARFTREAQTLASLSHPNIAAIYGIEESHGVRALVMELVEGDDLSQRITRGAIPLGEALPIAKQIAEALEAAHEQASSTAI